MTQAHKADADQRLARIAGQVTGIRQMIQTDRYCVDILTQIAAVRSALDKLGANLLVGHLETCVLGTEGQAHECAKALSHEELLAEVRTTLDRFLR